MALFKLLLLIVYTVILPLVALGGQIADRLLIADFDAGKIAHWQEKKFAKRRTLYPINSIDSMTALKAHAQSSASSLYRKIIINLDENIFLNWS